MTKDEAKESIATLSYGTLGILTGVSNYDDLDNILGSKLSAIDTTDVSECHNWQDVWAKLE